MTPFLHDLPNFKNLIESTAFDQNIHDPSLVEKDYWIMHVLFELQNLKFDFQLKGGTSLSKGFEVIHRFSEDIDIRIEPNETLQGFKVYDGKNQDDQKHRLSRKNYFDWIARYLKKNVQSVSDIVRDHTFDDPTKYRNGGIRIHYPSIYALPQGLKEGILLEVGFDNVHPNQPKTISSWAYNKIKSYPNISVKDNRALNVLCYEPKFTFVEKLQTIIRKYRLYKESKTVKYLPENFLRHYYDVYQLLELEEVQTFLGTPIYIDYKKERFKSDDTNLKTAEAFLLSQLSERHLFEKEYQLSAPLYFKGQPTFLEILTRIQKYLNVL